MSDFAKIRGAVLTFVEPFSYSESFLPAILKNLMIYGYIIKKRWTRWGSGAALVLVGRLLCPTLIMDSWGTSLWGEALFCQIPSAHVVSGDNSEGGKKYFATWFEDFFNGILGHLHLTTKLKIIDCSGQHRCWRHTFFLISHRIRMFHSVISDLKKSPKVWNLCSLADVVLFL